MKPDLLRYFAPGEAWPAGEGGSQYRERTLRGSKVVMRRVEGGEGEEMRLSKQWRETR